MLKKYYLGRFFWAPILVKWYQNTSGFGGRGVISHDPEEWCKIWGKTDLLFQKWQKFGEFWPEHSKVSHICTLIGSYCAKYLMFGLKKYRGVIFHDTEEWCKTWRKTNLWFGKWNLECNEELRLSVKTKTLMGSFCPKQKMHELKVYRGATRNNTEEWWKIWRRIDLLFQNWNLEWGVMRNLTSFDPKCQKICNLMGSFWPKYIILELKTYRGVILNGTEQWCKIWRKSELCFQKWHEKLVKFSQAKW